jgi:hypothetical protein
LYGISKSEQEEVESSYAEAENSTSDEAADEDDEAA